MEIVFLAVSFSVNALVLMFAFAPFFVQGGFTGVRGKRMFWILALFVLLGVIAAYYVLVGLPTPRGVGGPSKWLISILAGVITTGFLYYLLGLSEEVWAKFKEIAGWE